MNSLSILSQTGHELTPTQLEEVEGGFIVIMALAIFDIALLSYGIGYQDGKKDATKEDSQP